MFQGGRSLPYFQKNCKCGIKKQVRPQFSKYRFQMIQRWLINYEKPLIHFGTDILKIVAVSVFLHLIILLMDHTSSHSPNFGRPKQGQTFVVATFHTHFLNSEGVRILWVLAPKNFPLKIFGYGAIYEKVPFFTDFSCRLSAVNFSY